MTGSYRIDHSVRRENHNQESELLDEVCILLGGSIDKMDAEVGS